MALRRPLRAALTLVAALLLAAGFGLLAFAGELQDDDSESDAGS